MSKEEKKEKKKTKPAKGEKKKQPEKKGAEKGPPVAKRKQPDYVIRGNSDEMVAESGVVVVSKTLGPQLGSDATFLAKQITDHRKLAVLSEATQAAMSHLVYRGEVDGIRYFKHICAWELASTPSIGGLRARQLIQAIGASAGVTSHDVAQQPNWLARNVWDRGWKARAIREGKQPVEK